MSIDGIKQLHTESVSNTTLTPSTDLGTVRWKNQNEYVYAYNAGNSEIPPGIGVIVTGVTGASMTLTSVTQVSPAFGVVENATFATAAYGWVLTKGFVKLEVHANSAIATGDNLVLGVAGVWSERAISTGFVATDAHALASTASGGSVFARVNCNG